MMGRAAAWTKLFVVAVAVLVPAGSASGVAAEGRLGKRGSYGLDSVVSHERLHDVINSRDAGTVTFVITAEGPGTAADVSVTPPLSFGAGARYLTKSRLTKAETDRLGAESRAENLRLHRRGALPMAIRVPVAQLSAYDRFAVRASTVSRAGLCSAAHGDPWYLTDGICGSPGIGPNRARCTAVYAGRIVDADLGHTMSACEVDASDLKDVPCGARPCPPPPAGKGPRPPSARHGRATVVTGLRDDGSLAPRPPRPGDRVTFTVTGPPGREANVTLPLRRPAVRSRTCSPLCPLDEPKPSRRRLPYTFSVPAAEVANSKGSVTGDYTVKATTILKLPECPHPKGQLVLCAYAGPGTNLARCVATFRGRIVDTDLGGAFGTCELDANDLRPR